MDLPLHTLHLPSAFSVLFQSILPGVSKRSCKTALLGSAGFGPRLFCSPWVPLPLPLPWGGRRFRDGQESTLQSAMARSPPCRVHTRGSPDASPRVPSCPTAGMPAVQQSSRVLLNYRAQFLAAQSPSEPGGTQLGLCGCKSDDHVPVSRDTQMLPGI